MKINLYENVNSMEVKSGDFVLYRAGAGKIYQFMFLKTTTYADETKYYAVHLNSNVTEIEDFDDVITNDQFMEENQLASIKFYVAEKGYEFVEIIPSEQIEIKRI